ncbi:TonB-dependent receptor [Pedomonas mirosovicensis]|uniref:TonB-dependent receptor n=1 Tax=Pedomonas mirosovicensis TaxID=2908641 RepID=UPI0035BC0AE2
MMIKDRKVGVAGRASRCGVSSKALALALLTATPALAQTTTEQPATATTAGSSMAMEEIVVTGFRRSLEVALDAKRDSVSSVDVIVAEDIAKFPDQNLAESLQRIPGISILRDGGEGRAITVRGLGAQFTRVRVNGMETITTSTDGASPNRDRAFDFNVFASELFNSIVVHKTAEASLDEGSLGAVVDLNTGNPLAGKAGLTVVGSVQGQYNTLSKDLGPRVAGLVAWKNDDGTFGASVSAAYQSSNTLELGNNTVRWQQAQFRSVGGEACGGDTQPEACAEVADAFHPRIPRYGEVAHDRDRLGLTASVQWAPTDRTVLSIDGLYSKFKETRSESWGEVLFRSNEKGMDVVDYEIDENNNLIKGTFDNAWVRTESYRRKSSTEFYQLSGNLKHEFSDVFRVELLGGFSKSDASIPVETTMIFDDRDADGYSYDYTDMRSPVLSFGTSVTDPANFQLAEIRDRPTSVVNKFRTLSLKTEWDVTDAIELEAGAVYRRFSFDTETYTRDAVVCPSSDVAAPDAVLGEVTCTPKSVTGAGAVYGLPVSSDLATLFKLGKAGQPAGTTTEWLVPNIDAAAAYTGLYDRELKQDPGNIRSVVEEATGGYLQANVKSELFGLEYAANVGLRYMRTDQKSTGLNSGVEVHAKRHYDNWLPSANLALFPTEDIIIRGAVSKVMTRPSLGNLTPGGSVDGFNYRVSYGNPNLEPFKATAYDLAFEWYFAPQSIFSVAVFAKDIASFPISTTTTGTFASTGLPISVILPSSPAASDPEGREWEIRSIGSGDGGKLKGLEVSLQGPFRFLPGFWGNFGGIVNATFVDSDVEYEFKRGDETIIIKERLSNLSKRAYNATLYYEDDRFSARASVSYRSGFIDGTSATNNFFEGYNSSVNVDASVRYKLTEALELSLEGVNLTDDYRDRFVDIYSNRNYEYNHFGRTIIFGARYKM